MELVPEGRARDVLVRRLKAFLEVAGWEPFVSAPLLCPEPRFFPEQWTPDARGVRLLARRLLAYAGLERLRADVQLDAHSLFHDSAAAWFAGIEDGVCIFGADTSELAADEAIVGAMCHEVAHAYRRANVLEGPREREEEDTDLTTVYLGFGVLTLNNVERHETSIGVVGGAVVSKWKVAHTGYLSMQSMAYLLAMQMVVRGLDAAERKRILKQLPANQAACLRAALRKVGTAEELASSLGIPARSEWPDPPPLPTKPFQDDVDEDDSEPASLPNARATVFRHVKRASGRRAVHGVVIGTIVGIAAGRGLTETTEALELALATFMMAGAIGGWLLGRSQREDECTGCGARLDLAVTRCANCGGRIAFDIDASEDRLVAQELLEAHGDKASAMYRESRVGHGRRLALRILRVALVGAVLVAILVFLGR